MFLHTFNPTPILITFGPINVYWYGLFIVTGILAALLVILKLAGYHKVDKNIIIDSAFYLIIGGIIGGRIFHIFLELDYYLKNPLNIFKLWQGGLAIHGAIIAGIILVWRVAKKHKINFWLLTAIYVPGLAIAQAIGRWGNYFNQELFGKPTDLPWGIPIEPANRILEYYNSNFFHPAFLYESIGSLIIFIILIILHFRIIKNSKTVITDDSSCNNKFMNIVLAYLLMYSILRFSLEFIRIDPTPVLFGWRLPQITSFLIILLVMVILYYKKTKIKALEKINVL
jgi:phosphatidylglycerol---prolipoprotein diacylglyceryl transferase